MAVREPSVAPSFLSRNTSGTLLRPQWPKGNLTKPALNSSEVSFTLQVLWVGVGASRSLRIETPAVSANQLRPSIGDTSINSQTTDAAIGKNIEPQM